MNTGSQLIFAFVVLFAVGVGSIAIGLGAPPWLIAAVTFAAIGSTLLELLRRDRT